MIREKERLFRALTVVADLCVLLVGFGLACWLRGLADAPNHRGQVILLQYLWLLWIIIPSWSWALWQQNLYDSSPYLSIRVTQWRLFKAHVFASLVFASVMYLSKSEEISRLFLTTFVTIGYAGLMAEKGLIVHELKRFAREGRLTKHRVLLICDRDHENQFLELVRAHPHWGMEIVEVVEWSAEHGHYGAAQWTELISRYPTDDVIATSPWGRAAAFETLLQVCAQRGTVFRMLVSLPRTDSGTYHMLNAGAGNLLISLETVPRRYPAVIAKRVVDLAAAVPGLVLCGLVYLWYAPRLRRESPGPVLFKQERGGCNGRIFTIYKFRTMRLDAESQRDDLLARNEMSGQLFKLRDDPRVLPSGRLLRRYYLDELPQLWNVVKGDMSLIGPRPCLLSERAMYSNHQHRRFSVRPGITGPWQILGNGNVNDFDEVVRVDCEYIDNWSLSLDTRILFRTVAKIVRGDGW